MIFLLLIGFLPLFFCLSPSFAQTSSAIREANQTNLNCPKIPEEFGEVIYQCNGEGSEGKQLYIVGLEHRDAITRSNGISTSKVQAEVYKIGEWLILYEDLDLLLPEGFFSNGNGKSGLSRPPAERRTSGRVLVDFKEIEKRLADFHAYVNAEMLLKRYYGLRTRQVEDKGLYDAVHDNLCKLVTNGNNACDFLSLKSELDNLQGKRVAAMLQRIPEIIDAEFQQGTIRNKKALFTIGISHLPEIIKYLKGNKIEIPPSVMTSAKENYVADMNLSKEHFGITIIMPKKLAEDKEVLRMTKFDKIIEQSRGKSLPLSPPPSP